ncbi:MAG: glycosyltransferase family 2 protein [Phycisphaerales bacterium]|nr:glycosyltransferase family 2 protein [Phycisphaerales bacterium]
MIDVSFIIVGWNVRDLLDDCLRSVYEETADITFEVIYIDNNSHDGSVEMVREKYPDAIIIENEDNRGFIGASNQGIEIARGRYALLLNSDTIVLDGAVQKTVAFADQHPDAAVFGCRVLNPDRTLQRNCFQFPTLLNLFLKATYLASFFPKSRFFAQERMGWWDFDEVREVDSVCGCYSMARMSAIREVGLMDPTYFVYGDDPDWCYRFREAGWKVLFTPVGQIVHYGGQATRQTRNLFFLQLWGSHLIFMRKFRSPLAFRLACLIQALFFALRVPPWLVMAVVKGNRKASLERAWTCVKGAWYCLFDWTGLLMNKDVAQRRLREFRRDGKYAADPVLSPAGAE